jgi:serine/threonine-protein kinase
MADEASPQPTESQRGPNLAATRDTETVAAPANNERMSDTEPVMSVDFPSQVSANATYRMVSLLARGGMGIIYRGFDVNLEREVAIKVLRHEYADNPRIVNRFINESIIKSGLQHPGIAPVYASGRCEDDRPFYAMKLIDGQTLSRVLSQPARSLNFGLLGAFAQVCQTMAYVHAQGIVHLDLKPSNIMVADYGRIRVIDWGLSRRIGSPDPEATEHDFNVEFAPGSGVSDTQSGNVRGTPAYMAPEQARGELLDARTDVFSLGAILCEILTGQPIYRADHPQEILWHAIRGATGVAMAELSKSETAVWMIDLVKRCLSPNPYDRPAHAGELAKELIDFQESALSLANNDMLRFFELSPDLFCIAGFDGCFRRVNSNFTRVTGYSEQELLSQPFLNFVHPDDRAQTIAEMGRILQGLPIERFRNRYIKRDGSIIHLEWVAKSIVAESMTYAVARDVTPK